MNLFSSEVKGIVAYTDAKADTNSATNVVHEIAKDVADAWRGVARRRRKEVESSI